MNSSQDPVHLEIVRATLEQQPILANLFQLYAHDFSQFHEVELGPDGRFTYNDLPLYWRGRHRHPFLIMVDRKLAGFVLLKRGSEVSKSDNVWDVVEFFILRGLRRRGIGTRVAHKIWQQFPGLWEVRVLESNLSARDFWKQAIERFTGEPTPSRPFQKDGDSWLCFAFESKVATRQSQLEPTSLR